MQQDLLRELRVDGVAVVHFDELFADRQLWTMLSRAVDELVCGRQVRDALGSWAIDGRESVSKKRYLVRLYPEGAVVGAGAPWLRLGLHVTILGIVNAYLGLCSRLLAFDVWYTIADRQGRPARGSHNWNWDPEDRNLVKVFLYFSDVSEGCGPLQHIQQSRDGERNCQTSCAGTAWRGCGADIVRVAPEDIVTCTGRWGTLVFYETTGLRRGGYAVDAPRVLAKWAFGTPVSRYPRRFRLADEELAFDSAAARFAIRCT